MLRVKANLIVGVVIGLFVLLDAIDPVPEGYTLRPDWLTALFLAVMHWIWAEVVCRALRERRNEARGW